MKKLILFYALLLFSLASCNKTKEEEKSNAMKETSKDSLVPKKGFADTNGIQMYYEIYGEGKPLVLIHGGGSTIQTTFGRIIPLLAKNRKLICVELQAHGRTGDRNTPISFEQDADDVAALLQQLQIKKADFFGFSNGADTALQIAIRHPELSNKIVAGSFLLKHDGAFTGFWEFMKTGTFEQMPHQYKEAFLKVTPDSTKLINMFHKCTNRMINFKDFPDEQITSIKSPVLLINADKDVATSQHAAAMSKLIPKCRLAIFPGGHGEYLGEITFPEPNHKELEFVASMVEDFLDAK